MVIVAVKMHCHMRGFKLLHRGKTVKRMNDLKEKRITSSKRNFREIEATIELRKENCLNIWS